MLVANRSTRIPLRFVVQGWGDVPDNLEQIPEGMKRYIKNNGERAPSGQYMVPLKLDDFLQHSLGKVGGEDITPRGLIKYVANNYGGVHLGYGKEDVSIYNKMDHLMQSNGEGVIFALLGNLTRMTLSGLLPLRDAILMRLEKEGYSEQFTEDAKVADINVEKPALTNGKGTINFWLKSDNHPKWYADEELLSFPPMINGDMKILVSKNIKREILLTVEGIMGKRVSFISPSVPIDRTDPDHGVNIHFTIDGDTVFFVMQGIEVGCKKLQ